MELRIAKCDHPEAAPSFSRNTPARNRCIVVNQQSPCDWSDGTARFTLQVWRSPSRLLPLRTPAKLNFIVESYATATDRCGGLCGRDSWKVSALVHPRTPRTAWEAHDLT